MINRYALVVDRDTIDIVLKGLAKLKCKVAHVSCSQDGYMVIYRSDIEYSLDELKDIVGDV